MQNLSYNVFYKRRLPHIQPENGIFAISFRLAFTLPQHILDELVKKKREFKVKSIKLKDKELKNYKDTFEREYFEYYDDFLNKYNSGVQWLKNKNIAKIVAESFHFWNNKRYILHSYCIMPNHVHLIIEPLKDNNDKFFLLAFILKSIKQHTATEINKILDREGSFWFHESYDHCIRNEKDYFYQTEYLMNNPVKAGLIDEWDEWGFTYVKCRMNW